MTDLHKFSSSRFLFSSLISESSDVPRFQTLITSITILLGFTLLPTFPNSSNLKVIRHAVLGFFALANFSRRSNFDTTRRLRIC